MNERRISNDVSPSTEAWLRGPLEGFSFMLMPAAHALAQAIVDIERAASKLNREELWTQPHDAPSVAFHLRHIAGSIDRLLTYTRGAQLNHAQLRFLTQEAAPDDASPNAALPNAATLVAAAVARINEALEALRATPDNALFEPRYVGRAQLPTNVFGLLFHIAEHTQRHTGQIITTARIVRRA